MCFLINKTPGGKVEVGETLIQAVHREVFEETGLKIICNIKHIHKFKFTNEYRNFIEHIFYSEVVLGSSDVSINRDEHSEFSWVDFDKMLECNLHPNLCKILKKCQNKWSN